MNGDRRRSAWADITLVARREIDTRVRTRSFLISTIVSLLIVVGIVVVAAAVTGDDTGAEPERFTVAQTDVPTAVRDAVAATASRLGAHVSFRTSNDARAVADRGDVDAALVRVGDGYDVFSRGDALAPLLDEVLQRGVAHAAIAEAVRSGGGDTAALAPPDVVFRTATAPAADPERDGRMRTATFGVILLIMTVFGGGITVATGVIEEKSSRIVEILLATIKPARLLWGKILGIGAVMIGSTLLTAAVALGAGVATGLVPSVSTAGTVLAASMIWLLLGFLFYAVLYAATGAMLSRQEELAGTTWPLSVAALGTFYAVMFGAGEPDSPLFRILAWIPPFSAGVQPLRIADGSASIGEIVGSAAIMIVVCGGAVLLAGRIYQRSVLTVGTRVRWSDAVGRPHRPAMNGARR